jgi:hypothetical protein
MGLMVSSWSLPALAQGGDGGLTTGFSKLSPKERTRIARIETTEAAADSGYQAVMRSADAAFQAGDYEKAMAGFEQARALRPYNVYPKVKIQDLQALIKKRDAARATLPAKDTAVAVVANTLDPPVQEAPFSKEVPLITPVITVSPAIDPSAPSTVPRTGNDVPSEASGRPILKQPIPVRAASPPLILGERVFMEANSVVTERVVEDDGRAVVYRKVVHTSGQVFHFKDGLAVPERVWNERFAP